MAQVNRKQLLDCALCPNMCRCECPVVQAWGKEAVSPSGKSRLAHLLLEGRLSWSEEFLEALSACVGCRGCQTLCPFPELDLAEELLAARQEASQAGVCLHQVAPYLGNLKKFGSPYGQGRGLAPAGERGAAVLYFAGCTAAANNPQSVETALALLEKAGVSYQTLDEFCCGYPAEIWGDLELARQLAADNRERFAASGARTLVTGCPECRWTFTRRYGAWGIELPLEVVDSTTFFLGLIREGRLQPRPVQGIDTVTYHDPCLRARLEEDWERPRELLGLIPGLTLVEAASSKEKVRCCGGGQMAQLTFPALAETMARRRLAELPAVSAALTDCPFCRESLLVGGGTVMELTELLGRACIER
ncbi:MAG TPA: (Fe-S)-binding protein [Bacillota bacterium]|nr:(Fe-S)-binding protein [Bacillota bacterium]